MKKLRYSSKNGFYHVRDIGLNHFAIFNDYKDRQKFRSILQDYIENINVQIAAYCIMNNHFHLLVKAFSLMLCANYVICTVDVVVRAPDGQVLVSYDPGYRTTPETTSVSLQVALDAERLVPYANGKNTIHVYAQLANGEYKEAYSGLLQLD